MSEIMMDLVTTVKLFTAAVMFVGGILLAVCFCCCLRDIDTPSELGVADSGKKTFDECIENKESAPQGEDASAQRNKCYTVKDETISPNEQPENSTRF